MGRKRHSKGLRDFEATALPHMEACFRLAMRLTGKREDAEDLVQEAYMRAFRFFHRFEPGTNFKAWIFKVLYNIFLNETRKRSTKSETVASPNLEFLSERMSVRQGHQRSNDPERLAMKSEMMEALQEALRKLPVEFRTVVHLADIEGCNYKEIASVVECPMGTVMSRLHRGRRLLREVLLRHQAEGAEGLSGGEDDSGDNPHIKQEFL